MLASSGSDTYNNLFSDLSPLIALFGEQVTKQFLSQSLDFGDCLVFAAAPLGILTGVVSAVRLGGYAWLRATIGRAAESRGAAGIELTSATSSGICELWDGKSVIRIQGSAKILSILFIDRRNDPGKSDPKDGHQEEEEALLQQSPDNDSSFPVVADFESGKALGWIALQSSLNMVRQKNDRRRTGAGWDQGEDTLPPEETRPLVRNPIPPIPPNIALNASSRPTSILINGAALFTVLTQCAVLVLAGILTYSVVPSDGNDVPNFAFPLLALGTGLVFTGMVICAWIVVSSSRQETWLPRAQNGRTPRLVWLQSRQTVNDESFPPYAIFPKGKKILLSLAEGNIQPSQPRLVLFGTFCAIVGFIFQFIGLRSLYWAVSVAQLVAMFITTGIRVSLYMPYSKAMTCQMLPPNFELEWLTNELISFSFVHSNGSADLRDKDPLSSGTLTQALSVRSELGKIAADNGWRSTFNTEALQLKDTIDGVMNILWNDAGFEIRDASRNITEFTWTPSIATAPCTDSINCIAITITRKRRPGMWTPWAISATDLESPLALWLYDLQVRGYIDQYSDEDEEPHNRSGRAIWEMGPLNKESCLNYDWWIRRGFSYFSSIPGRSDGAVSMADDMYYITSPLCRRPVSSIYDSEATSKLMAVVTHSSLAGLCSKYLLMSFLESVLSCVSGVRGTTRIRLAVEEKVPEIIQFEHTAIDKLASTVSAVPVFNLQESYILIVPSLRSLGLLPDPLSTLSEEQKEPIDSNARLRQRMVHAHLRQAKILKYTGQWKNANKAYSRLISWLEAIHAYPATIINVKEIHSLLENGRIAGSDSGEEAGSLHGQLMMTLAAERTPKEVAQDCSRSLQKLDMALLTGYARIQGPSWLIEVLILALTREDYAAVSLILLELMDETAFKTVRFQLIGLAQHIMQSKDMRILETMLLYYTPGPVSMFPTAGNSLVAAARFRNLEALRILKNAGLPVDARNQECFTALMEASSKGYTRIVKELLAWHADSDAVPPCGGLTALAAAILGNCEGVVDLLLASGATANPPYRSYGTPLQLAARKARERIVRKILEAGADIHYPGAPGNGNAMQTAVEYNHTQIIDLLLQKGASVNEPAPPKGRTSLQHACLKGHTETVQLLLAKGAEVNASAAAEDGLTALQAAALGGHRQILVELLQRNANVNAAAALGGYTALQAAAATGNTEIFELLMAAGAKVKAPLQRAAKTVLQAACFGGHFDMVKYLLAGSDVEVNEKGAECGGLTALQAAARSGDLPIVQLLLDRGADVNAEPSGEHGRTALQAAAENGSMQIVIKLPEAEAKVNASSSEIEGFTALQIASKRGHIDMVDYLLEKGADIAARPCLVGGRTALQAAAEAGHFLIVQHLLAKGAYANEQPAWVNGVTAWQAAYANGFEDVASFLSESGATEDLELIPEADPAAGWMSVYPAELPVWTNSPVMDRGWCPNGLPDTEYHRVRAHVTTKGNADAHKMPSSSELCKAAAVGDELLIEELLEAGHDVNETSYISILKGRTPLQSAAEAGHDAVVKQLIDKSADVNALRAKVGGCTALEAASTHGYLAVVRRLLAAGADVNPPDPPEGETSLYLAAAHGHCTVVKELLDAGADAAFVPEEAWALTALQAAEENGWKDVVKLLSGRGGA